MMPGMNPQMMMKRLMKQLKTEEIDADEVIIKSGNRKIIVKNPQVTKMTISGQDTFQIMGEIVEEEDVNPDDIKMIVENTGCSEKKAVDALAKAKGDLAEAIMRIKEK